jgi:putative membrane-bound dehydrogenase-like protein
MDGTPALYGTILSTGLRWGPDGWLYGRHGILATSLVGAPGTPSEQRTKINAGHLALSSDAQSLRGRRARHDESVGHGLERSRRSVLHEYRHSAISGISFPVRITSGCTARTSTRTSISSWASAPITITSTPARAGRNRAPLSTACPPSASDALGGGHAHCGCLIYQGDQWPEYWRGKVLTINFHGRRLNVDRLERRGSGYVAKHEPDAFFFGDPWFRGIDLIQAPDGGVFVADWNDASECHDNDGVHRTSGRIYKITYDAPKRIVATSEGALLSVPLTKDVAAFNDLELVQAQFSKNEWFNRTARRISQERAANRPHSESVSVLFRKMVDPDFGLNDQERAARRSPGMRSRKERNLHGACD